jgi:hypothetical protein
MSFQKIRESNGRETAWSAPANFPILQAVQGYWQAFSLKGGYGLGLRQVVRGAPLFEKLNQRYKLVRHHVYDRKAEHLRPE